MATRAPILSGLLSSHCISFPSSKIYLGCSPKQFIRKLHSSFTIPIHHNPVLPFPKGSIDAALPQSRLSSAKSSSNVKTMSYGMVGRRSTTGRVAFSAADSATTKEESSTTGNMQNREIMVQHILVPEDKLNLIIDLQMRIVRGEDMGDLATQHSICPSKEEGGMLGWVQKGQMVTEFEEAAFGAPLNKLVRCKTKFGWHLLQVLSEREGGFLKDIEPEELHLKMQDVNFVNEAQLMDVREQDEVSIASLPGFKIYPLRQFGIWGPTVTTDFDPSKDTYVMCHHGVRSLQVARWLQSQGFKHVFNVSGGIHRYSEKVDRSIPTY